MQILTQLIFSGIALGMIYAVIAFGYQLTFATSDTLNFGQGDALMLGALVGLTLVGLGLNYWLMIPLVCLFGAFQGAVVERIGCGRRSRSSPSSAGSCRRSHWASSSRTSPRTSGVATT
jgi:branched-subunit amino acid ABC-type transport system permease component